MAHEDDMKQYGAGDFERYYSGKMTEPEKHALEKAALDDPFLSDALDGYALTNSPLPDIETINKRLSETGGGTTIIPLKKNPFTVLLRIAAAFILFSGLAWLFYENNKIKHDEIAVVTDSSIIKQNRTTPLTDSINTALLKIDTANQMASATIQPLTYNVTTASQGSTATLDIAADTSRTGNLASNFTLSSVSDSINNNNGTYLSGTAPASADDKEKALAGKVSGVNLGTTNTFKGRIVNNAGAPLSFANVYYDKNNQGISANQNGLFQFYSPDSAPLVSVNAMGYKTLTTRLKNDSTGNYIVMAESKSGPTDGFANNNNNYSAKRKDLNWSSEKFEKKATKSSFSAQRVTITNAIPVNGWQDFNTYVKDSLKTLDQLGNKASSAEVLVFFNVDDEGRPIDVYAGKSLCNACVEEAVRIIKNGPAWKLNKKRKKANAVVKF